MVPWWQITLSPKIVCKTLKKKKKNLTTPKQYFQNIRLPWGYLKVVKSVKFKTFFSIIFLSTVVHFVGLNGDFSGLLKCISWPARALAWPIRLFCSHFLVIFYFQSALLSDDDNNLVYVRGHKYVLSPSQN